MIVSVVSVLMHGNTPTVDIFIGLRANFKTPDLDALGSATGELIIIHHSTILHLDQVFTVHLSSAELSGLANSRALP